MTIFLATLVVITALVFGAPLAHAESLSDMPPVGTYIGFPGRHIPRLTVGTDGFSISSHIASCVTIKSTLKQDKDTHVVAFDARCTIDGKTWISHEKWRVFSENGETYLATITTTGKGRPTIDFGLRSQTEMKVWITVDTVDGQFSVRGPYHPDEIDTTGLLMRLNTRDLATVTLTNANPLKVLQRKQEDAEAYTCADCGYRGFGGWNCNNCGQHNLIRS